MTTGLSSSSEEADFVRLQVRVPRDIYGAFAPRIKGRKTLSEFVTRCVQLVLSNDDLFDVVTLSPDETQANAGTQEQ